MRGSVICVSKSSSKTLKAYAESMDRVLTETMLRYGAEVAYDISIAVNQIGQEAKERVKRASPKRHGTYRRGWRVDFQNKDGHIRCIVYQKSPHYRRTHLLEDGHKSRSGSRVKAQPHIRPVEEWAEREVLKAIEKAVKA